MFRQSETATFRSSVVTQFITGYAYSAPSPISNGPVESTRVGTGRSPRGASTSCVSPYSYADNEPTLLTDPSRLPPEDPNSPGAILGDFGPGFLQGLKALSSSSETPTAP
ncbi:hypothetical protein [Streptomyces sp. TE33382]